MSARTMTQLVEGQPAALDVGESLPCRIIGFSGPEVVLALEAQPEETIAVGMRAYLMLESNGQLQAVRGEITAPSAEEVVLRLTDDIRLGQRRVFSRAPIPLPAEVRTKEGSTWTTTTRDVSAGGVCVGREGADPGDGPLELKITVASHEVVCEARVMRLTDSEIGVQFERIQDADRLLLASLALAYHRPR
jgi:c-di-GMP-binding flagellar brake protein YcgR